mmetsp:Transcript_25307/g.50880  ORF Transcript_25307/g.50880 Transcript_25307/m.50880 type:complete len:87 (+) Transcript_25307:374-634(+)
MGQRGEREGEGDEKDQGQCEGREGGTAAFYEADVFRGVYAPWPRVGGNANALQQLRTAAQRGEEASLTESLVLTNRSTAVETAVWH